MDAAAPLDPPRSKWPLLILAATLLYLGVVFHGLLFLTDGVFERDGFFHARYCQLLPERGFSREFPWMQFTAWKDHFADKDTLYHVLLAPFCTNAQEPLVGAKYATVLLALLVFGSLYAVLRLLRVPYAVLFVLLLATGSGLFLNRLLMIRSHVLSITLMLWSLYFIVKQRHRACTILAFVYMWSYSFPAAMLITAAAAETGRMLHERKVVAPYATISVAAGLLLGAVIHPYSPDTFLLQLQLFRIAFSGAVGSPVELASEFLPVTASGLVFAAPGITLALLAIVVGSIYLWRAKRVSSETIAAATAALAWSSALFVFSRLIEYAAPLTVLALGLLVRDWLGGPAHRVWFAQRTGGLAENAESRNSAAIAAAPLVPDGTRPRTGLKHALALAAFLLAVGAGHYWSLRQVRAVQYSSRPFFPRDDDSENTAAWRRNRYFDGAAGWLKQNVPAKAVLLNFHWDDFPELFYAAPEFHYLVGLDPTLMRLSHPGKTELLEAMRTGQRPLDFVALHATFGSEYMVMRNYRAAKFDILKRGEIRPVFADDNAVIYRLKK